MNVPRRVAVLLAALAAVLSVSCSVETGTAAGLVASAGPDGIAITTPEGRVVATDRDDAAITQPTWSRDGRRVVSTDRRGADGWYAVVRDGATAEPLGTQRAPRSYFFYSWSDDSERIAALGPGPLGTTLDILGGDGSLVHRDVVAGGSVFLAWEPGGADLLVHVDDSLALVDGDGEVSGLGRVGADFMAPSWIPGTRDAVVVVSDGSGPRLRRLAVDGELPGDDLGEARGLASILVDPHGERLAVVNASIDEGGIVTASARRDVPVQSVTATTEVIDLASGERTTVTDEPTLWIEWSTDGRLLVGRGDLTAGPATWSVWHGGTLTDLVEFVPSPVFLFDYIAFAGQYVESPRLWSPDGRAFTFGGLADDGEPGVVVVDAVGDDGATRIGPGDVGFWSPGDPRP